MKMNSSIIICLTIVIILIAIIIRLATNKGKLMENYEYPYHSTKGDPVCEECKTLYNKCKSENPASLYYGNVNNSLCDEKMGYYVKCSNCNYAK
jgi:hypothetical protein